MTSISAIPTFTQRPHFNPVKPAAVSNQPALQPIQPVAKVSDGDHDGSTGGTINTHA